jgi:CDP-paratose 2-epimerase
MKGRSPKRAATTLSSQDECPVLVTGGAGFIGANLANRLATGGRRVIVYDNLSRAGVERNLAWLKRTHGERITATIADIRDEAALRGAVRDAAQVFHLAAQVAVTTSLVDPCEDFSVNAGGTLTLLEALRTCARPPSLVFTSTNKVYGTIDDLPLERATRRYRPVPGHPLQRGVDETRPLDFHSPYGCSKGTADQYVLDYARSYGLSALVFRMSCIYGPRQCGSEDQGWVAHFLLRALRNAPITIYGDGRQVRDILYIDDLVSALLLAQERMGALRGQAFNIGGGPANTTSLIELIARIAALQGEAPKLFYDDWRTGDQRYYVSDHGKFTAATGWHPTVGAAEGIARLRDWLLEQTDLLVADGAVPAQSGRIAAARSAALPVARPRETATP